MKQTAVEWLLNEFQEIHKDYSGLDLEWLKRFEQAKETEKQQTIEFAEWCLSELLDGSEPKAETMQGLLEIFKNK